MLRQVIVVVAVAVTATVALEYECSACSRNLFGDFRCNRFIKTIMSRKPASVANYYDNYSGNLCVTNSVFRCSRCAKACADLWGGCAQAQKAATFVPSWSANGQCVDNPNTAAKCSNVQNGVIDCTKAPGIERDCAASCGFCDLTTPTAAACDSTLVCLNSTTCNMPGATTYKCTGDGTGTTEGGKCSCGAGSTCISATTCTGSHTATECNSAPYACVAQEGTCGCNQISCTLNAACTTDVDCGGMYGSCMLAVGTGTSLVYRRCKTTDTTGCQCKWCPDSTACRGDGSPCSSTDAVSVCGHAGFCRITADGGQCTGTDNTACSCKCAGISTDVTADTGLVQDGKGAPICIEDLPCGTDNFKCGDKENCIKTGTTSTACDATGTTGCTCKCGSKKTPHANPCLGAATDAAGTAQPCTLGSATACGRTATSTTAPGALDRNVCMPNYSSTTKPAQCTCAAIYPTYSAYAGKKCTANSDCQQTATAPYDTSSVCDTTANLCVLADATKIPADQSAKCYYTGSAASTNWQCGWGTCVTTADGSLCTDTTNPSTTCGCRPAGCIDTQLCALTTGVDTCGGYGLACEGKCSCTTA